MVNRLILASILLLGVGACTTAPEILPYDVKSVPAVLETDPMPTGGDRADDPALWVHPSDASKSLILGTNKEEGLYVYGLDGKTVQFLDVGRVNNVDLRGDIAVGSNDEVNGISWFQVTGDESAPVQHLGNTPVSRIEPYGICLGEVAGRLHAGVTYKDGAIEFWQTENAVPGKVPAASLVRTASFTTQLEGCVFDDEANQVFIGQEELGIWSLDLSDPASEPVVVDQIADANGLVADVEGLSLWLGEDGDGYLVASAQAADRFVVYDRKPPHAVRGAFQVSASADGTVDAVTHTDGLDVTSVSLPGFPKGVVIVQDDGNPAPAQNQNFKLVDWRSVAEALELE